MPFPGEQANGSPSFPADSDGLKLRALIDEIDSLTVQQMANEARRQEALATTATASREIDLAQDLLHTSLQRIAELDDDICHARNMLSSKIKTLEVIKSKTQAEHKSTEEIINEAARTQKILDQKAILVRDLQQRLLQSGVTPEGILKIYQEAMAKAVNTPPGSPVSQQNDRHKPWLSFFK